MQANQTFERHYVWDLVVRSFHWTNAACILALTITGYLMGSPPAILSELEAYNQYWFGTIRFLHFSAGYILFINLLVRVYWAFRGSKYARWQEVLPHTRDKFEELVSVLKTDILQTRVSYDAPLGHNALAGLTYVGFAVMVVIQVVTGFGLYEQMSSALIPNLFGWVVPLFGGDLLVKAIHHNMMWFFIIFTGVHIYIASYHDYVEGTGILSSMFSGWKFHQKKETRK
ncbi:MAG: Ni/Fe-hydrogenase, b-type cytochrome subunit [Leptonema illini]|uniref:Ni/Fe-hydrogenase, b-type cytochrome subunit n=1 Tax=Leptonema illini TaxID=183 RepID=A0A833M0M4_9LEPT|nr:MAG: Ni/Fe-hydrogenase, b-type cytochrome subunit [Leptonema illini]